jgi:predicted anti-sigma-YlaC factor YlaD
VKHLSQEQFDALVMGIASEVDETVREHLATCSQCARRLARESRLELELYEAATTLPRDHAAVRARPALKRTWRSALSIAAALAVVAGVTWFVIARNRPRAAPLRGQAAGAPLVHAPCIEDPRRLGPGACAMPAQDVCRYVVVERSGAPSF